MFAVTLLAAAAIAMVLLMLGGILALLLLVSVAVLTCTLVRPVTGLYAVMISALLGDFHLNDANYAAGAHLFKSLTQVGLNLTPMEVILVSSFTGLLIRLVFDSQVRFRPGTLLLPIGMLMAAVALACMVGISRGADMAVLRQEVRGLIYVPILYLLVTHFVTRREQITRLMWVFVIVANFAAAESIYRYYTAVRGAYQLTLSESLAFAHENSLLYAAAIIVLLARLMWSRNILHEWKSFLLLPIPLVAMLLMHRRAGMVALDGGLVLLCVVLMRERLRTFLVLVPLILLGFGLVLAATWNSPGGSGEFARSYRSATGSGDTTARDASSDLYRQREELNIRLNIQGDPIIGQGFGRPYTFYVSVADLSADWPLWDSVPHNSVLWIWMDAGILGFLALAILFAASICRSMQILQTMTAAMKPYAFAFGAIVFMFFMYSWVDLGLITPRTLVLFALALGGIASMGYISASERGGPDSA